MKQEQVLRSGFTTGACGAAAAKAAAQMLFSGKKARQVSVMTPAGRIASFKVEEQAFKKRDGRISSVSCAVRKDAGDDPDVTNGVLVFGRVSRIKEIPGDTPCYQAKGGQPVYLTGGEGIGIVTKAGLSCPVGYYAINPVPRAMILDAVLAEWENMEPEPLLITISIPEGRFLAKKTFNPRLGIIGGISVLGTTGIVNPMSEQALIETIRLDIRVHAKEGKSCLLVAPGNYGEEFLRKDMGLDMDAFVKCSNFVGDTFQMIYEEGIRKALFAGHLGKLIKVAGGVMNTHSRYGDRRMEFLYRFAITSGMSGEKAQAILTMNTTEEAAGYLAEQGMLYQVMADVANSVKKEIEDRTKVTVEVILFTANQGIVGRTKGVDLLKLFNNT